MTKAKKKKETKKSKPYVVIVGEDLCFWSVGTEKEVLDLLESEEFTGVESIHVDSKVTVDGLAMSEDLCKNAIVLYKNKIVKLEAEKTTRFILYPEK